MITVTNISSFTYKLQTTLLDLFHNKKVKYHSQLYIEYVQTTSHQLHFNDQYQTSFGFLCLYYSGELTGKSGIDFCRQYAHLVTKPTVSKHRIKLKAMTPVTENYPLLAPLPPNALRERRF